VAHPIFLGYSNGCLGYLPPPSCYAEGGMEVVESSWNYNLPSQLTPGWAPAVVDTALQAVGALFGASPGPASADFVLPPPGHKWVSDDGQIDQGVRYPVLLKVLVDFLASDGGATPKEGFGDTRPKASSSSGVTSAPCALTRCHPCKL
jgi:hypothetical protein